jgi:hypothetical protein
MNSSTDWRDRHILTHDLQEAFVEVIPSEILSIRISRSCSLMDPLKCLEGLKVTCKVTWPMSDVLQSSTNGVYQQILTFLLQIQRTKYLLDHCSSISQQRERRGLKRDVHIVHVVRLELLWFVNTMLNYLGVVVLTLLEIGVDVGYSTDDIDYEGQVTGMSRCGGVVVYSHSIYLLTTISMSPKRKGTPPLVPANSVINDL